MSSQRAKKFAAIDLDKLDEVQGGADPANRVYGWSGTVGYGIGSFTATRTDEGNWYFSPGLGLGVPSFRLGASVDRISVTPKEGNTADDVLKEWSYGGAGHVGVGGSVYANDSGKVVGIGVGLDAGGGVSYGVKAPTEAPSGTPVYDPMGNFTGVYEDNSAAGTGAGSGAGTESGAAPHADAGSDNHYGDAGSGTEPTQYAGEPTTGTGGDGDYTGGGTSLADNSGYGGGESGYGSGDGGYGNDGGSTMLADAGNESGYSGGDGGSDVA